MDVLAASLGTGADQYTRNCEQTYRFVITTSPTPIVPSHQRSERSVRSRPSLLRVAWKRVKRAFQVDMLAGRRPQRCNAAVRHNDPDTALWRVL
jgi:hypothetical protein